MSTVQTHPLVDDYLRRLHAAAWLLPPDRRDELIAEIREHIEDALQASGTRDEVAVRNVLERLGPPEEIVAAAVEGQPAHFEAAREHDPPAATRTTAGGVGATPTTPGAAGPAPARRVGGIEISAMIALAIGGVVVPLLGLVVGIVLAWASTLWTRADKLVATALPGAFMVLSGLTFVARTVPLGGAIPLGPGRIWEVLPSAMHAFPFVGRPGLLLGGTVAGGMLAAIYLAVQAARRTRPG